MNQTKHRVSCTRLTAALLALGMALAALSCSNAFQEATGASSSGGGGTAAGTQNPPPDTGPVTISSVSVSGSATVRPDGTAQYSATVNGTGTFSNAVTWSVTGASQSGTGISIGGLLTVDRNEAPDTELTVKALAADGTTAGTLTVTVSNYAIGLSGSSDNFPAAYYGYTSQSGNAITITVENTGNLDTGPLTAALDDSTTGTFTLSPAFLSSISVGQSDTNSLTIYPGTGLAVGDYTAVVKVTGDQDFSATVSLGFTVNKADRTGPTITGVSVSSTGIAYTLNDSNPAESTYDVYYKQGNHNLPAGISDSGFTGAGWSKVSGGVTPGAGKSIPAASLTLDPEMYGYSLTAVARDNANYNDSASTPVRAEYYSLIDLGIGNPAPAGIGWTYSNPVYTILANAQVTVQGTSGSQRRVQVAQDATGVNITLKAATITGLSNDVIALLLNTGAEVTLTLEGASVLESGNSRAGIQAPPNTTLTITSTGDNDTLTARGGNVGAGIGGKDNQGCGTVTITGNAKVIATGGNGGAGIGGGVGSNGNGGTVTISGNAQVTATGGGGGAGIGGSSSGAGGTVYIYGGTVTAIAAGSGRAIGGGSSGDEHGSLTISPAGPTYTGYKWKANSAENTEPQTGYSTSGYGLNPSDKWVQIICTPEQ